MVSNQMQVDKVEALQWKLDDYYLTNVGYLEQITIDLLEEIDYIIDETRESPFELEINLEKIKLLAESLNKDYLLSIDLEAIDFIQSIKYEDL